MSSDTAIVEGILYPDGRVQLDSVPNVTPGRVTVTLQPASALASRQRGLADVIDEIHQGQQARGFQGRSAEEIDAALNDGEEAYEQRMTALRHLPSSADTGAT
jgi:hypothetical protein